MFMIVPPCPFSYFRKEGDAVVGAEIGFQVSAVYPLLHKRVTCPVSVAQVAMPADQQRPVNTCKAHKSD